MSIAVNSSTAVSGSQNSTSSSGSMTPTQTLDQDDFLNLLVTQLKMQDPLNPESNTDFIAQMAQFSSLSTNTSTNAKVTELQSTIQFQQANGLLGRTVVLQPNSSTQVSGTVSGITIDAGTPKIVVNGQAYDLNQVVSVALAKS
ncbi:MAG: flagellar hook capping protein [Verrucomicrobia bacterium]|nr:flagellar hook capping protein [Verrucomicrobiota bacterium]